MRKLYLPLVFLIAALSMLATASLSRQVFEHLPHLEDELTYLFQARMLARGDVFIPSPYPPDSYWQPFIIDCDQEMENLYNIACAGKRFGKYPPGFPLLLALGVLINNTWIINVFFTGLNVVLIYLVGRFIYNEHAAILSAALLAISPIALLLGSTLMGHTSALSFTLLFTWAYIRAQYATKPLGWAALSGVALGMVFNIRPYAAAGISLPFIVYSLWQMLSSIRSANLIKKALPLLVIALAALCTSSIFFINNYLLTGKTTTDLYRLIWDYDRIGFGANHGPLPEGHSLRQGWIHTKRDLRCYSRDLFGWALPTQAQDANPSGKPEAARCFPRYTGLSWLLLPFSILLFHEKSHHIDKRPPDTTQVTSQLANPGNAPHKACPPKERAKWTALLLAQGVCLITLHLAYWTGAEVYSARYYFEATGSFTLLTGAAASRLITTSSNVKVRSMAFVLLALLFSLPLLGYTQNRFAGLHGFGCITSQQIDTIKALRKTPDTPVLVIVNGRQNNCPGNTSPWREYGALMALTDPYLESEIIAAAAPDESHYSYLLTHSGKRQIILMINGKFISLQ
ncbi:MAG: hypothetical protein HPY45_02855 [Anaerolineae bacterium]|nr:hypothetical protein [Anaerolineae bacterium]